MQFASQRNLNVSSLKNPQFLFGTISLWYARHLFISLRNVGFPAWRRRSGRPSAGKLKSNLSAAKQIPWLIFFAGCGLANFRFLASSHAPYQRQNGTIEDRPEKLAVAPCS